MTNILFIAFEFPPLNRGGVHRSLAFAKYLPQFGINPVVVTLAKDSYAHTFDTYSYDEGLGAETRKAATIVEVKADKAESLNKLQQFISIYFSIHGNEAKYWEKNFHASIGEVIRKHDIKAVFATVPPFSILPIALTVAEKHKLPLIYDFRDAWSQWRTAPYGTKLHYRANLYFERKYLDRANAVVVTSKQTLQDFQELHGNVPKAKFVYIPNGYNEPLSTWKGLESKDSLVIGYVGSFYFSPEAREQMLKPWWKKRGHRMLQYIPQQQDWLYRSPYFFFRTLQHLNETNPEIGAKIKVRFVGKKHGWMTDMIKECKLENQVELVGELPHKEALAFQKECDMLLITSAKRIGGADYSIAGKTFEYIQAQKPILAFACEGAQKDILADTGMSLICDPDDAQQSAQQITDLVTGKIKLTPDNTFIKTLSREYQAEELANVITRTISNTK